jgi:glycerol-3-phosphate dehydrogenase
VFAGLRPLVGPTGATDTARLSRRHVIEAPAPGLTTIAGGKYTTYRAMAADGVDTAAREFPGLPASSTARIPLCGAERFAAARAHSADYAAALRADPAAVARLLHRYGDRVDEVLTLCAQREELRNPLAGAPAHLAAEIVHACTHEGALHLEDVLERRTRLAINRADRALDVAAEVAALMAGALGWSEEQTAQELAAFERRVAALRAGEAQPDDARALEAYRAVLAGGQIPAGVRQ